MGLAEKSLEHIGPVPWGIAVFGMIPP
jgi:hypothetical protein